MKIRTLLGLAVVGLLATAPVALAQSETPAEQPKAPEAKQPEAAAPAPKQEEKLVYVTMKTSLGDVVIELNNEKAPISTRNFLSYTDKKFYDGTIFHRVIPNFMVQGGGFTADMTQKPTDKPIKNEWQNGLKNTRGTLAMARLGEMPDSATSQFFINVKDNGFLDMPRDGAGYAVFGRVVSGMDVVDKMAAVPTGTKARMTDVPVDTVTIVSIARTSPEDAAKFKEGAEKK